MYVDLYHNEDDWVFVDIEKENIEDKYYIITYEDLSDLVDDCGRPISVIKKQRDGLFNKINYIYRFYYIRDIYNMYSAFITIYIYGPMTFKIIRIFLL